MSKKINLPTTTDQSDGVIKEELKTIRASIDAEGKQIEGQLDVIKESVVLIGKIIDTVKAHKNLQATAIEWEGRVRQAELSLEKTEKELEKTKDANEVERIRLRLIDERTKPFIDLINDIVSQLKEFDLSPEQRSNLTNEALELGRILSQLK